MMARVNKRATCDKVEARSRLAMAKAYQTMAELGVDDSEGPAGPQAAAGVAVLAAIAASDAMCCFHLGERSRSQDHQDAIATLQTVAHSGREAAKILAKLLQIKDSAQYGTVTMSVSAGEDAVKRSARLISLVEGSF